MARSRSAPCRVNAADPDVVIVVRVTGGGAGRVANHTSAPPRTATTSAPAVSAAMRRHSGLRGSGAADAVRWPRCACLVIEHEERRSDVGDPVAAILDEAALQQRADRLRHVGRQCLPVRLEADHRAEHLRHVLAIEGAPARQHLVQHAAERPDVAALVRLASLRLLRRHVRGRAEQDAHAGHHGGRRDRGESAARRRGRQPAVASRELRQTEVEHLDRAVGRDLDVRGLQVAMDDALLVRGFEGLGDLTRDRQGFVQRNRPTSDPIGQRVALDQFEDERVGLTAVLEPIDRRRCAGWFSEASTCASRCETGEAIRISV